MIQAVLFDMDGLLIDSGPIWKGAYKTALSRRGLDFDQEQYLKTAGLRLREAVAYWSNQGLYPSTECSVVYDEIHNEVMKQMITCPYMPGAEALLEHVRAVDIPLALVSASERMVVDEVVETKEWDGIFSCMVTAEDVSVPKPDPEAYLRAATMLEVDIGQCIIFEDSVFGVTAANASGARTIAVPKHGLHKDACMNAAWKRFDSLADISKETLYSLINQ